MNQNSIQVIGKPNASQVLELERRLKGERLEMFQEAFDVLHEEKEAKNDPAIKWRLENIPYLYRGFKRVDRETNLKHTRPAGVLHINVNKGDVIHELGLASVNQVTNDGVKYIIDAIRGLSVIDPADVTNLNFHGSGTADSIPESAADTTLQAETGSRVPGQKGGNDTNLYSSTATIAYTLSLSIVEHGLFWASTGATLFDRSVFTAIPVDSSTSIEFTYTWTLNAGG